MSALLEACCQCSLLEAVWHVGASFLSDPLFHLGCSVYNYNSCLPEMNLDHCQSTRSAVSELFLRRKKKVFAFVQFNYVGFWFSLIRTVIHSFQCVIFPSVLHLLKREPLFLSESSAVPLWKSFEAFCFHLCLCDLECKHTACNSYLVKRINLEIHEPKKEEENSQHTLSYLQYSREQQKGLMAGSGPGVLWRSF